MVRAKHAQPTPIFKTLVAIIARPKTYTKVLLNLFK